MAANVAGKKIADKAKVPEEKLEHYLLGGPGSKDPKFTEELFDKTGIPKNWDTIDDLDGWMAKMGLNSQEILKILRTHSALAASEEWHIDPKVVETINQQLAESKDKLLLALGVLEDYHQQVESLDPKFKDRVEKAFRKIKADLIDLGDMLGENRE